MMDGDFDTTTWRDLFEGCESIDRYANRLQRIAILFKRCGSNRHKERWHQVDSDLQYEERVKISKIKRGNHPHRQTKRPPQPDDNEIVTAQYLTSDLGWNLGYIDGHACLPRSFSKEIKDKFSSGKLTKGEFRDARHELDADYSGQRIKVPSCTTKVKYDPRIDVASTKPSDCNRELQMLLQGMVDDEEDIKEHQSDYNLGVDESHILNGIDATIRSIISFGKNIRKLADDFSCYSVEEFIHHPYHQHKNIISNLCNDLDSITNNSCLELEFIGKLYDICDYIIDTTIPSLSRITMKLRSGIIVMQGCFYSKTHAVAMVTKYKKYSKERSNIINDMVNNKYVPNRTALDGLLKMKEENKFIVEDMWNTRDDLGTPSELVCQLEKERITSITDTTAHVEHCRKKIANQIRKKRYLRQGCNFGVSKPDWKHWKDIIAKGIETTDTPEDASKYAESVPGYWRYKRDYIVQEIVANQNELAKEAESELIKMNKVKEKQFNNVHIGSLVLSVRTITMRYDWTPGIDTDFEYGLYAPPVPTQISNTIGLTGERLYFSPHQFPVTDVNTAGDSEAFQQLKDYITSQSSLVGDSPLIFHGTDLGSKRFICKYALKSNWKERFGLETPFKRCSFALVVKWDKYGFYINSSKPKPLHNKVKYARYGNSMDMIQRKCVVGCEFHCHPTISNKLSRE